MTVVRVTLLFLLVLIFQCNGVPRFANYIQDHMVLQRAPQKAVVWGFGDPSTLTTLTINDKTYTTMSQSEPSNAQNESIWSVTLDPVTQEEPFDIHVSQPLANGTLVTITIHDILFGDVWICSGQSNMQFTVSMMFNATEEIANAGNYPKIRVFTVIAEPSAIPLEELLGASLNWSVASPASIGGPAMKYMSAVCWLYGRMIQQALGGRPIGLIGTSFGGTSIELWMSQNALHDCNITKIGDSPIESYNKSSVKAVIPKTHLYNAMIYPLTRMVIYGAIWYQGEANRFLIVDQYACALSKMIYYWREVWNNRTNGITDIQFPFGVVQLATWSRNTSFIGGFPWVRWHQTFDVGYVPNSVVPKVFMAVTCDLRDDVSGLHPRTKLDVGYRLSRSGLAVAYGQQVEFQGPIVQSVTYKTGDSTVNITYTAVSNIELRDPNGFDVCCVGSSCSNDSLWVTSTVSSKNGLTVTVAVNSTCVGKPLYGLRYLWRETPCLFKQAAIYSSTDSNLPSPPYLKLF